MLYADYNATSPISPAVTRAMQPFLASQFGNPSSTFQPLGARAKEAIELAREQVASFVGARPSEIVFVSGGTESCSHALIGAARTKSSQCRIVYSSVEHSAVLETVNFLREFRSCRTSEIAVSGAGMLDEKQFLRECQSSREVIVSLMSANNETGVRFPIARLAERCRELGDTEVLFHTDAVQTVGKERVDFSRLGVDLLSISAHKFGGPKGIGALIIRQGSAWQPVVRGGGQESGRRGGTEAVAQIVGMGQAAQLRQQQLSDGTWDRVSQLRDQFEDCIQREVSDVLIHGSSSDRLTNTSSLMIAGINSKQLRNELAEQGVIIASGSACSASQLRPSHVLRAMGNSVFDCLATIRISLGVETTEQEVEQLVAILGRQIARHRRTAREVVRERLVANT